MVRDPLPDQPTVKQGVSSSSSKRIVLSKPRFVCVGSLGECRSFLCRRGAQTREFVGSDVALAGNHVGSRELILSIGYRDTRDVLLLNGSRL